MMYWVGVPQGEQRQVPRSQVRVDDGHVPEVLGEEEGLEVPGCFLQFVGVGGDPVPALKVG